MRYISRSFADQHELMNVLMEALDTTGIVKQDFTNGTSLRTVPKHQQHCKK